MNTKQRKLARAALGLPNANGISYRNRYMAPYRPGHPYDDWQRLVDAGNAERARAAGPSGAYRFWLTPKGAKAALQPGERLCSEDFPNQ